MIRYLIIPDNATVLSALRTGKIDVKDGVSIQDAQSMKKTNPSMLQIAYPANCAVAVEMRNDKAPLMTSESAKRCSCVRPANIASSYYAVFLRLTHQD